LEDACHNNSELNLKLDDAQKQAEKFCLDLKKANKKLKQNGRKGEKTYSREVS
jgi:hypothetical protein